MQKTICALLLFFSVSYCFPQKFEIGGQLGINSSHLTFGNFRSEAIVRLQIAITGEYSFSEHFSLQGNLGYTGKGGKQFNEGNIIFSGVDDLAIKIDYANLGLALRYYPIRNDRKLSPFLAIGPNLGFMLSAKDQFGDISDEAIDSKTDISAIFGIGGKLQLNNSISLEVFAGYERGWNKILSAPRTDTLNNVSENLFNESFFLTVGIKKTI